MPWTAPAIDRQASPSAATGEREMLEAWLDFHRQTLLWKCSGLTTEQLRERAVEPSSLSLLGLVRHMADVERVWFRTRFAGQEIGWVFRTDSDADGAFNNTAAADPEQDFATFVREVDLARAAARGRGLDETFIHPRSKRELNLRWVYLHMIEEYARHNGHADLLRQRLDGMTGA
jgi:uncharacterized damage-inducible protein DinB